MKKLYSKYSLQLVREKELEYSTKEVDQQIKSPIYLANFLHNTLNMGMQAEEIFVILTLDIKSNITGIFEVSRGSLNKSVVSPREVFKRAILNNAAGIVAAHNHPAGSLKASDDDIRITQKLKDAGELLGIKLIDHLIITENSYSSLREEGLM